MKRRVVHFRSGGKSFDAHTFVVTKQTKRKDQWRTILYKLASFDARSLSPQTEY